MKSKPRFQTLRNEEVYRHGTCLRNLQQRRALWQQRQPLPPEDEAFLEAEHPARPRDRRRRGQTHQRLHALPPFRQGRARSLIFCAKYQKLKKELRYRNGVAAPFAFLAFQMRKIPVAVVQPIVASTSCAYVSDLRHSHPMTGQRRTP